MKKAFFFTADAIIAALVLSAGIAIFFTAQPPKPDPTLVVSYARGMMNILGNTGVAENPNFLQYVDGRGTPVQDIDFPDNSILEQIAEFHFVQGKPSEAEEMARKMLVNKPENIGVRLQVFDKRLSPNPNAFCYPGSCTGILSRASVAVAQDRVLYIRTREPPYTQGPFTAELEVWQ